MKNKEKKNERSAAEKIVAENTELMERGYFEAVKLGASIYKEIAPKDGNNVELARAITALAYAYARVRFLGIHTDRETDDMFNDMTEMYYNDLERRLNNELKKIKPKNNRRK